MGIVYYKEPQIKNPDMICSWPGIGNIGLIAMDTLRAQIQAEEFAEIEPFDFFEPRNVIIKEGLIQKVVFPTSKFYSKEIGERGFFFFVGEDQPSNGNKMYGSGKKAYNLANLVLDIAQKYGCQRIYTSGACVSLTHHQVEPRVVAVASSEKLLKELKQYPNVVLMSEISERSGEGMITGLNGLLLAMAKKRGLDSICLMGEIPDWLSRTLLPYPKASASVLKVFADILGVIVDFDILNNRIAEAEKTIEGVYKKFPPKLKEQYDQRMSIVKPGPITKKEAEWMKENLDDFLKSLSEKKGGEDDDGENPVKDP